MRAGAALELDLHLETLANAVSAGGDPDDERDDYSTNHCGHDQEECGRWHAAPFRGRPQASRPLASLSHRPTLEVPLESALHPPFVGRDWLSSQECTDVRTLHRRRQRAR